MLRLLLVLMLGTEVSCGDESAAAQHEYCIIGGGLAGLQLARLLQQGQRDYLVFERGGQ